MTDNDLYVIPMLFVVAIFASACAYVLTVEYADVETSRYHEAETVCNKANASVKSFDRRSVKCKNGAMFDLKEEQQ